MFDDFLCEFCGQEDREVKEPPCTRPAKRRAVEVQQAIAPVITKTADVVVKAWVDPLLRAAKPHLARLGSQRRKLVVSSGCSGTGAPTLVLKACALFVDNVVSRR